jgi:phage shock protein PspC (stress-responsive transcriptional regulator)
MTSSPAYRPPDRSPALTRPRHGRIIAGVCAGLARRFGLPPWVVRLIFVLSCLLPGPQVIIYIVLWLVMPEDSV